MNRLTSRVALCATAYVLLVAVALIYAKEEFSTTGASQIDQAESGDRSVEEGLGIVEYDRYEDDEEWEGDEDRFDDEEEGYDDEGECDEWARGEATLVERVERQLYIAEDDDRSAAFAMENISEEMDENEAIDILEDALKQLPNAPNRRRLLRMKLVELYADTEQIAKARPHAVALICGK